jgi:hypothetical protein
MRGRPRHINLERTGTIARNRKVCVIPRPQHTAIRPGGKSVSATAIRAASAGKILPSQLSELDSYSGPSY